MFFKILFSVFFVLLVLPGKINSETVGSVITFQESITYDEEEGRLFFPSFVFTDPVRDEIYIIDGKGRIVIYTSDFFPLFTLGSGKGIQAPQGLTVDHNGNLYVAQAATTEGTRNRISIYSECLKWKRDIYLEGFEGADTFVPYRLAVDKKGYIYVASSYFPGVLIFNSAGRYTDILTPVEDNRMVNLTSVTLDGSGKIYLVSEEEGRIYVYDENRKFIFKFGEKGGSTGKLSRPKGVGIDDRNGRMYVVDYMRHTVAAYGKDGTYLFEFGGMGWGEGWFQHPNDITVDKSGRMFVADLFNQRVQVFNSW